MVTLTLCGVPGCCSSCHRPSTPPAPASWSGRAAAHGGCARRAAAGAGTFPQAAPVGAATAAARPSRKSEALAHAPPRVATPPGIRATTSVRLAPPVAIGPRPLRQRCPAVSARRRRRRRPRPRPNQPLRKPEPRPPCLSVSRNLRWSEDRVASGLRPLLDGGLDWLQANGYRTVLHLRQPGEDDTADRKQVEKRGMKYLSMEVSPETLTPEDRAGVQPDCQ